MFLELTELRGKLTGFRGFGFVFKMLSHIQSVIQSLESLSEKQRLRREPL